HLQDLEIEGYRVNETGRHLVDQYVFENLLVSSLQTSNAVANSVSVDFSRFDRAHAELDEKGGVGPVFHAGWDFESNTKFGVAMDADLGKDSPLPSVESSDNLDYFIRFNGQDWMRLDSFSLGMSQSGSLAGGGGGTGKATPTDVHTLLGTSGQLVELGADLTSGKHVQSVEIEVYGAGGKEQQQLLEQFYFEDVLVTDLHTSAGSGSGTSHSLSFDYAAFNRGHVTQDAKGGVGSIAEDGFDFRSVSDADGVGPAIQGDAIKAKLENVDSLDSNLQYYVSWEGSGGWLELNSFSVGATQQGSTTAGGGGTGKAIPSDLSFTLGASAQLLQLEDALTSGKHLKALEIEAYHSGSKGAPELVDQYVFEDLLVSSLQTSNAVFNSVSVDFAKFSRGHIEYTETGAKGATTEAGWDFVHNVQFHAPVDSDLF